jgi:outer membrane protein OmpA-like peptidoglycan-associated protein
MANSMMDSILAMVTPEMKQAIASRMGESPQAVQGALGSATAATLGGLAARAGDGSFLSQIMNLATTAHSQNLLGGLASVASSGPSGGVGDLVNKFLPMIFGAQQTQVASALGQQAGISATSAMGLLKMAAPLVLGFLGKGFANGSLNVGSLASMLKAEAPSLQSYLPSGLMSSLNAGAGQVLSATQSSAATVTSGGSRWLIPLAIIGALLLIWLFMRSMHPKEVAQSVASTATQTASNAASAVSNAANQAWVALGEIVPVSLPDGTALNAPKLGVEGRLVTYLNDSSAPVSEDTWFDFDRLVFATGSATLEPASQDQLNNVALIMKAYPKVKIRIGGYTDNTGDPAANQKLSEDRANSVMAALAAAGVDPTRMDAKGYGPDHPIADNSSEEGRQKNRRVSLRVTEK